MTTMGSTGNDDYVPPRTDDPYGLRYLAEHPETVPTENRKAELLARLTELRNRHKTEGTPP